VITFPSTGSSCNVCNAGYGSYICYDGSFAQPDSTSFTDPTPQGSQVIQIKLSVTGVYALSSNDFEIFFNLNNDTNVPITVDVPPNSNGFTCSSPCTTYGGQSTQFLSGIPGWNYGGSNFIGWSGYAQENACFSELDLTIIYTTSDSNQFQATIKAKR